MALDGVVGAPETLTSRLTAGVGKRWSLLLALSWSLAGSPVDAMADRLFSSARSAPENTEAPPFEQEAPSARTIVRGGAELRTRRAEVLFDTLHTARAAGLIAPEQGGSLELNLFEDTRFKAVALRSAPTASGYSLSGRLAGVPHGTVTLVVNGDTLIGTVRTPGAVYTIESGGSGPARIRQVDPSVLPPLEEPLSPALPTPRRAESVFGSAVGGDTADDEIAIIDVLVVYTPDARDAAGGQTMMEALVDLRIAVANQAYEDSGVNQRVFLTRASEVDYREQGDNDGVLSSLQNPYDGPMDVVHEWRDQSGADLVHLILARHAVCGTSFYAHPQGMYAASKSFALSVYRCDDAAMVHEFGHNMGLLHDRYVTQNSPSGDYWHGYVNQAALQADVDESRRWRTIMAYSHQCDHSGVRCPTILRFSNPDQTYLGDPLGVSAESEETGPAGAADARRALNEVRMEVACYRAGVTDLTVAVSAAPRTVRPGATVTMDARVNNRCETDTPPGVGTLYRSTDAGDWARDMDLDTIDLDGVPGGTTITWSIAVLAPSDPGTYNYRVCLRPAGTEQRTADNCSPSVRLTVDPTASGGGSGGSAGGGGDGGLEPVNLPLVVDVGGVLELDIQFDFHDRNGPPLDYLVESANPSVAVAEVDRNSLLTIRGIGGGVAFVTVTAADDEGARVSQRFRVTVRGPVLVPLFPPASHPVREGFVRVINHSAEDGELSVEAVDDQGMRAGPVMLTLAAGAVAHFNSRDLENGNAAKGLEAGVGPGEGDWRLILDSDVDIEVLSYQRTRDGFLTGAHNVAPARDGAYHIATFNPASNPNQVSSLRLINPGSVDAELTVTGIDDAGAVRGAVRFDILPGQATTLTAADLESGAGVEGALGDGAGKWRLTVASAQPVVAMSLLESPGGHLTNLSTVSATQVGEQLGHVVPLFPSASNSLGLQGFVRVANRSAESAEVRIRPSDDRGTLYHDLTLTIGAGETAHFNSNDLELGNAEKRLLGRTGAGAGDWWLVLSSQRHIEVLSYIRTGDGFLTSMHDVAPSVDGGHWMATFNPGSNVDQVSSLRLVNPGEEDATVEIAGIDDSGAAPGSVVSLTVPGGAARTLTSAELESGADGLDGALGDGVGKWRLRVVSGRPVVVMSLLSSPTGHLSNLSIAEGRGRN